jgi:hypothetical protein
MKLFTPMQAASGDWVFVNGDYLDDFLSRIPTYISKKFTVVIHNTDRSFGSAELTKTLRVANKIYAINTTVRHPQLTTIPIGFSDTQLGFLSTFTPSVVERDIEIYGNFTGHNNRKKRGECAVVFHNKTGVVFQTWKPVSDYYADLCRSKFVLCPEGTGIDTHRVYESILCGATPVILRNSLSHLYETLPVCIVDRWEDPFYVPKVKEFPLDVDKYL